MTQTITSAATSVNMVPRLFKNINWKPGTYNLDIGGGRFQTGTDYLAGLGVTNLVYDPYNRSEEHNRKVLLEAILNQDKLSITMSNVLNVIQDEYARHMTIALSWSFFRPVFISVYEGDKSGEGKITSRGWQENRRLTDYRDEVMRFFGTVEIMKKHGIMLLSDNKKPEEVVWLGQ